ncbi:MAG: hypothetical protein ACI845_000023 [Gammaproteobacteria bacterium]|jgi:hypothetical protein
MKLPSVQSQPNHLLATFRNDLTNELIEIETDQVVVEQGTAPIDEVFTELRNRSINSGVTDIDALLSASAQPHETDESSTFRLYRIGHDVSSRSLHAAILDAYRIAIAL